MATLSEAVLRFLVDKSQAESELRKVESSVGKSGQKMARDLAQALTPSRIFTGLVTGAAAAFGQIANVGIQHLRQLDTAQARFRAETGASAEEAQELQRILRRAFRDNVESVEQLAAAAVALRREMGLTTAQVGDHLQTFLDFAKVTGQDDAEAIRAVDDVMDAWGLTVDQAGTLLDRLKRTSELTGASVKDMQAILQQGAGQFQALGFSLDEVLALLGKMAQAGIAPERTLRGLAQAVAATKSPAAFLEIVRDLGKIEDQGVRSREAVKLFGRVAGADLARLIGPGGFALEEMTGRIRDSEGTVRRASQVFDDNLNTRAQLWRKRMVDLAASIGGPLFRAFGTIGAPLLGISQLLPVLTGGFALLTTRTIPALIGRLGALRAALVGLTANPWTIVITLIGAAAVAGALAAIGATVQGFNREAARLDQVNKRFEQLNRLFPEMHPVLSQMFKEWRQGDEDAKRRIEGLLDRYEALARARGLLTRAGTPPTAPAGELGGAPAAAGAAASGAAARAGRIRASASQAAEEAARREMEAIQELAQTYLALAQIRDRGFEHVTSEAERAAGRMGQSTEKTAAAAQTVIDAVEQEADEAFQRLQQEIDEFVKGEVARLVQLGQALEGASSEAQRFAGVMGQANAANAEDARTVLFLERERLETEIRIADLRVELREATLAEAIAARQRLLDAKDLNLTEEDRLRILREIQQLQEQIDAGTLAGGLRLAIREFMDAAPDFRRIWTSAIEGMRASLEGFFSSIQTGSKTVMQAAIDAVTGVLDAVLAELNQLAANAILKWILGMIPFGEGGTIAGGGTRSVFPFKRGGLLRSAVVSAQEGLFAKGPTLAAIAEEPGLNELVLPLPKGLRPQDLAAAIQRGGAAGPPVMVNNVFNNPVVREEADVYRLAREVGDQVRLALRMNHPLGRQAPIGRTS